MNKEKMTELLEELSSYNDNDFIVGAYLLIRYGLQTFQREITEDDLKEIQVTVLKRHTIFESELNYKVDRIINNTEEGDVLDND